MKLLPLFLFLFGALSCLENSAAEEFGEEWDPLPQGFMAKDTGGWIADFDHVHAVLYNPFAVIEGQHLVKGGKLHPGVAQAWTKKLSDENVAQLKSYITGKHKRSAGAFCYYPRHGFIFYGKNSEILGHIEICFSCGNYFGFPTKGLSENWDLTGLQKLFEKIDLPASKTDEEWSTFFADEETLERGPEKTLEQKPAEK